MNDEAGTVWVIEQGEYSDYHVVGVYRTREDAELVLSKFSNDYDKPEISEWPLNPGVDDIHAGRCPHHVIIAPDGTVERARECEWSTYNLSGGVRVWRRSTAPAYQGEGIPDAVSGVVYATSIEHAIKIVNEKRVQFLASGELSA
jgi:hypothetical protein